MDTFLNKTAKELIENFGDSLSSITIVLPNRRSKVFLIDEFQNLVSQTIIAPDICSIQELVERISGIQTLDSVEQLFEFYKVYSQVSGTQERQSFEQFAPWAKVLLKDFSEIDSYLIEPNKIFRYLKEIKDIEHWALQENKTPIIEKHLKFWSLFPVFYQNFYRHLKDKNIGYQGLVFKEAAHNISSFIKSTDKQLFVFAGFNALMPSEEKIIQSLLKENKAKIYWDIDKSFIEDTYNQAGHFIRKYKNNWSYYKTHPFDWITDEFSKEKNINIIGTAKSIGQAKVVGKILENQLNANPKSLSKTALVLSEKSLLIPVLYALPSNVDRLNVTLEYSARNNPIQFLINRLFRLHIYAKSRKGEYVFYYKDVLEVLSNPFVESLLKATKIIEVIKNNNFTFITHQKLYELLDEQTPFFELIFDKWPDNALEVLDRITEVLLKIKENLQIQTETDKISLAFVFEVFKVMNQLKNYFLISSENHSIQSLYAIYKQIIDNAQVSFEGEPLTGLQIMGILESRTLDFENVIITSVNEGKIPFGKSNNSFIPYDVRMEYEMPTYRDRDAIYTYHFYRLLSRAKNIYLIYNTEDEGLDAGEKSRFITQLKIEQKTNHFISERIMNAVLPSVVNQEKRVEKSDEVIATLKEIATKGFSPSSLSTYIRNPMEFYYQRILKIYENKEVEETIEANTLGNVIHNTLEALYQPYLNTLLTDEILEVMESRFEELLIQYFKENFKEGDIKKGKNLLAFESAKRSISKFLKLEKNRITQGDEVVVLHLEKKIERTIEDKRLPYPVKIAGLVDRIEVCNGNTRIIDYKTGRVDKSNVELSDWSEFLNNEKKDKIIQLLSYVFMYEALIQNKTIETGIISFKNLNSGFLSFRFKNNKTENQSIITSEVLEEFKEQVITLLNEILDPSLPFQEK